MPKLRLIAATAASVLAALALSVGAALAEDHQSAPAAGAAKQAPSGVCILHDIVP